MSGEWAEDSRHTFVLVGTKARAGPSRPQPLILSGSRPPPKPLLPTGALMVLLPENFLAYSISFPTLLTERGEGGEKITI